MLVKAAGMKGLSTQAKDGVIGEITDLFFDDESWTVRYLVIRTGTWLFGRSVLISPVAVEGINREWDTVSIGLTKEQIKNAPPVESDRPVTRQYEKKYHSYYKWPMYWGGRARWGNRPAPSVFASPGMKIEGEEPKDIRTDKSHLRSMNEIKGYVIKASGADTGYVYDLIINDKNWAVSYIEIEIGQLLPGKHVLLPHHLINSINQDKKELAVGISREGIQNAPLYNSSLHITEEYEDELLRHFKREKAGAAGSKR